MKIQNANKPGKSGEGKEQIATLPSNADDRSDAAFDENSGGLPPPPPPDTASNPDRDEGQPLSDGRKMLQALEIQSNITDFTDALQIARDTNLKHGDPDVIVGLGLLAAGFNFSGIAPTTDERISALRLLIDNGVMLGVPAAYAFTYSNDEQMIAGALNLLSHVTPRLLVARAMRLINDSESVEVQRAALQTLFRGDRERGIAEARHICAGDAVELKPLMEFAASLLATPESPPPLNAMNDTRLIDALLNRSEALSKYLFPANYERQSGALHALEPMPVSYEPERSLYIVMMRWIIFEK